MTPQESFEMDKAGIQDATVSDFLLPYLLGRLPMGAGAKAPMGKMAPLAEDAAGTELREGLMRSMAEPAKGYASGGIVMPDMGDIPMPGSFDIGNNSTTMRTAGNIPPPPPPQIIQQAMAQMAQQSVPQGTSPIPMAPPPPSPAPQTPSMQDILAQARSSGQSLYGQYTPEKRNDLYMALLERQNSMPNAIGSGLASVGDAIARGYGRSQTNFLDNTLKSGKDTMKEGMDVFDAGQKGTLGMTQSGLEIGKMDPNAGISKMYQDAYADSLKSLGYSDEQIKKLPAANIETIAQIGLKRADIQTQKDLKEATIALQAMIGAAQIKNQEATRRIGAAEAYGKRGVVKRARDFVSESPETEVLRKEMEGSTTAQHPTPPEASGAIHPQASAAELWARENPNDPRSAEILKRLGK